MSGLYDFGREGFLGGDISWRDDTIKAVPINEDEYTPNYATHQYLSDVPSAARAATAVTLTNKTITAGVADADDVVFESVAALPPGEDIDAILIYADSGTENTSRLIAYIDEATGLSVAPNGGDINVTWSDGANKIFKL